MKDLNLKKKELTLVLASKSPRRFDLLSLTNLPFLQIVSDIKEESDKKDVIDFVIDIAAQKGSAIEKVLPEKNCLSISADTIVVLQNRIYGKPKDYNEAFEFLKNFSGKSHRVITGVCLRLTDKKKRLLKESTFHAETIVHFNNISRKDIEDYLESASFLDKAGAYGIQEAGMLFINKVEGSVSNVYGLPIDMVLDKIKNMLDEYNENGFRLREIF